MKNKLEILNTVIVDFMKQTYSLVPDKFDDRVSSAKKFADINTSIELKDLIDLITMKQDGNYPGLPTFEVAKLGVHILWVLSENPDFLVKVATTKKAPWYVKVESLECLRLSTKAIPWPKIIKLIKRRKIDNEIKWAALSSIIFHDRVELLPQLKTINLDWLNFGYFRRKLRSYLIFTRASLGDTDVIIPILELRNDLSLSHDPFLKAAWEKLLNKRGGNKGIAEILLEQSNLPFSDMAENIWMRLQRHENKSVVHWAIKEAPLSELQIKKCLNSLSNVEWEIRNSAVNWLIANQIDVKHLSNILSDQNQERITQSYAAYIIANISDNPYEIFEPHLKNHDIFKVSWDFEVPAAVRDAVVKDSFSFYCVGGDIRYALEKVMCVREAYTVSKQHREALIEGLKKQRLTIKYCQSVGEFHREGGGNYWVAEVMCENTHIYLHISDLGKFIECVHMSEDFESIDSSPEVHPIIMKCKTVAERLGFLWLDSELLDNYVPIHNESFESNEPEQLRDLLFDWNS